MTTPRAHKITNKCPRKPSTTTSDLRESAALEHGHRSTRNKWTSNRVAWRQGVWGPPPSSRTNKSTDVKRSLFDTPAHNGNAAASRSHKFRMAQRCSRTFIPCCRGVDCLCQSLLNARSQTSAQFQFDKTDLDASMPPECILHTKHINSPPSPDGTRDEHRREEPLSPALHPRLVLSQREEKGIMASPCSRILNACCGRDV